jgi:CelD/BcsL family acetyltransferase involved in cellulose biosynthesis
MEARATTPARVPGRTRTHSAAPALEAEVHGSCELIAPEWDRLAVETGASPFLRPGWITAWWHAFAQGRLEVLTLRRGHELRAALPLVDHGAVVKTPTNWHTPAFGPVVADEAAARRLLEELTTRGLRRIELSFVDEAGPLARAIQAASGGYSPAQRTLLSSPYVQIQGDWDSYLASRSKNLRRGIKRRLRRLEEQGKLEFEIGENLDEALLEEGFELEALGWKGKRGTAILSHPETAGFYREIAEWAARERLLRLASLRLDGRLIAFELALQDERSYYVLKPAYDPELSSLAPGMLLMAEELRHAFDAGLETFEFLGADDEYKLRWANGCHERVRLQLFSDSAAGRFDRLVQTRWRPLGRRVYALVERTGAVPVVTELPPELALI